MNTKTTTTPLCRNCRKKLRANYKSESVRVQTEAGYHTKVVRTDEVEGYGYHDNGHFCTLRCGFLYAINFLEG